MKTPPNNPTRGKPKAAPKIMNCFKNQVNYLLTYPRSGQHLLTHMLRQSFIGVYISHELMLYKEFPPKPEDRLFMIVRDHKECLPRHLYPNHETVGIDKIDDMFKPKHAKPYRAMQFIENLVLFDMYPHEKILFYYEDMLVLGKRYFCDKIKHIADPVLLDWDYEFLQSLENYSSPKMSGGKLHFHVNRLSDPEYLTKRLRDLNPYIFDKYLKRYET